MDRPGAIAGGGCFSGSMTDVLRQVYPVQRLERRTRHGSAKAGHYVQGALGAWRSSVTQQERQRSLIEYLDALVQRRVRTPLEDEQL